MRCTVNCGQQSRWHSLFLIAMTAMLSACGSGGDSASQTAAAAPPSSPATSPPGTPGTSIAPSISGTPSTRVTVGQPYNFVPTASDPDSSALTFSIQGKPSWATFSTVNGSLTGTPTSGDLGTTSGIVIQVSDGQNSKSLPAFSLQVAQVGMGTAVVSWVAPTTNTDGSALTNISGFRIYYGSSASALTQTVDVAVGQVSHQIGSLDSGTYYFAVTTRNASGEESGLSNIATKAVL